MAVPLDTVTSQMKDLNGYTFDLIEWALARGQVTDLVVAARNANPGNPELFDFAKKLGLSATDQPTRALEAFVSANQSLLDVQVWRERLTKAEWAVCRVDIDEVGTGSGFLVGPDAVPTNYHVVETSCSSKRRGSTQFPASPLTVLLTQYEAPSLSSNGSASPSRSLGFSCSAPGKPSVR